MIASELISYDIPPLKLSDTGAKALDWMEEFKTSDLPVIDNNKYIGLIGESEILDRNDIEDKLSDYNLVFKTPSVNEGKHMFEVVSLMVQHEVSVLPVVDADEKYLGVITPRNILEHLSKAISVSNAGSILTLEVNIKDYSLSEISRMVESDDAIILASFIMQFLYDCVDSA